MRALLSFISGAPPLHCPCWGLVRVFSVSSSLVAAEFSALLAAIELPLAMFLCTLAYADLSSARLLMVDLL